MASGRQLMRMHYNPIRTLDTWLETQRGEARTRQDWGGLCVREIKAPFTDVTGTSAKVSVACLDGLLINKYAGTRMAWRASELMCI